MINNEPEYREMPSPLLGKFDTSSSTMSGNADGNANFEMFAPIEQMPSTGPTLPTRLTSRDWLHALNRYTRTAALVLAVSLLIILCLWVVIKLSNNNQTEKEMVALAGCDVGWIAYKDQKCLHILDVAFQTWDEAVQSCTEFGATLPIIRSKPEQDFLTHLLFNTTGKVENFWIGARFDQSSLGFRWLDGTLLSETDFTNWAPKSPHNRTDYCVHIQAESDLQGQWTDEACDKRNFVVCERVTRWPTNALQQALFAVRFELQHLRVQMNQKVDLLNSQLASAEQKMVELSERSKNSYQAILDQSVPIGFLYTELPGQKAPQHLWPSAVWTEVSSNYSGVFFRVVGGNAADFGTTQLASSPKLRNVFSEKEQNILKDNYLDISVPDFEWSGLIYSGSYRNGYENHYLKFKHSTDEVRPINVAIRLWIRTA